MSPWQAKTLPATPNSFLYRNSDNISMRRQSHLNLPVQSETSVDGTSTAIPTAWQPNSPIQISDPHKDAHWILQEPCRYFCSPPPTTASTTTTHYQGPSVATSSAIRLSHKSIPTWATSNATPNTPHTPRTQDLSCQTHPASCSTWTLDPQHHHADPSQTPITSQTPYQRYPDWHSLFSPTSPSSPNPLSALRPASPSTDRHEPSLHRSRHFPTAERWQINTTYAHLPLLTYFVPSAGLMLPVS